MLRDLNRWEVDRPISPVEMSPPRRVEEMHRIDDEQILSSAPRLNGNFDTRKVSKLPSFLHKNGKRQGFEWKNIVKTLLFGCAYFFYAT